MERFNLRQLNEIEGKEKYRVEVCNRFAAFENLDADLEIMSGWETIEGNSKISATENLGFYELKSISHGLTKNAQNNEIKKENKLNCDGYRIEVK
jgi:hypothetical protein